MNENRQSNTVTRRSFVRRLAAFSALSCLPAAIRASDRHAGNSHGENHHRILSANIRVALADDDAKGVGWGTRKNLCIDILRRYRPDILCLQEVLKVQDLDLKQAFAGFTAFGFEGPDMDAHPDGYHGIAKNVLLFSQQRYDYVSSGCFWLSDTPLIAGSLSWNTARARHCNWIRLCDKHTGRHFRILNTHLDHLSAEARERQIALILDEARQYAADFVQILAGDFNCSAASTVVRNIRADGWVDAYAAIHGEADPGATAHAFQGRQSTRKGRRIDFIFCRGAATPLAAEIVRDDVDGRYPSDHYFILADLSFQTPGEQATQTNN
jgi:endonuclease/exonuclease/phosphatase family metal-dependent hydrolase